MESHWLLYEIHDTIVAVASRLTRYTSHGGSQVVTNPYGHVSFIISISTNHQIRINTNEFIIDISRININNLE